MIIIRLETDRYTSDRHTVSIRTSVDDWKEDIALSFAQPSPAAPAWFVALDRPELAAGFEFKFSFNGAWQNGENLSIPAGADQTHTFRDVDAPPPGGRPEPVGPLPEWGRLQSKYFPPRQLRWAPDVIVVGSGMGGGTIADQLADLGAKVLLLEAGGLVFPTHIANLPRRQRIGEFDKHMWQLWPDFKASPYAPEGNFRGGQGFNLGGRSIFWGGFIPRMTSWELDFWPRQVKWDLEDTYYDKAEALLGKSTAPTTLYTQFVREMLRRVFPKYAHKDAPMAVRVRAEGSNWIPGGLFSTADLLMESALTTGRFGNDRLEILLNHDVVTITPTEQSVTVSARDLLGGKLETFNAAYVVLAGGTIESAKIAKRSRLVDPNALIGKGITDHPVYFTHFKVPSSSAYYEPYGNVKILSQPKETDGAARDPFNVLIELGADFNHGRYLDPELLEEHMRRRDFSMLCEVVFLCNQELQDDNLVDFPARGAEMVKMANAALSASVMTKIENTRDALIGELGGQVLIREDGSRSEGFGGLGGVAHEVGTLRMRVRDGGRVDARLAGPSQGLVDENGAWLGHDRLYVCDLSIFPTSPAANPSLTLVALALRMAETLARKAV